MFENAHEPVLIVSVFRLPPSHLHPPEVENCDSNSRLVVDEDYNRQLRLARVNLHQANMIILLK